MAFVEAGIYPVAATAHAVFMVKTYIKFDYLFIDW